MIERVNVIIFMNLTMNTEKKDVSYVCFISAFLIGLTNEISV